MTYQEMCKLHRESKKPLDKLKTQLDELLDNLGAESVSSAAKKRMAPSHLTGFQDFSSYFGQKKMKTEQSVTPGNPARISYGSDIIWQNIN